tara:strand:+ start:162 stop:710 length:549 start_codon:yes stop_codon:yes gene_type:complete
MSNIETIIAEQVLGEVTSKRGMMWEKIAEFQSQLEEIEGVFTHKSGEEQSEGLQTYFPLEHTFEGGLYTRQIFMPKGAVVVSMIHKKQHPSFLLKGELSYLTDEGKIVRIKAPYTVFTQAGAQRVFYIHEDVVWTCVHKTNKTNVREAELELFSNDFKDLPKSIIDKRKKICQQQQPQLLQQ